MIAKIAVKGKLATESEYVSYYEFIVFRVKETNMLCEIGVKTKNLTKEKWLELFQSLVGYEEDYFRRQSIKSKYMFFNFKNATTERELSIVNKLKIYKNRNTYFSFEDFDVRIRNGWLSPHQDVKVDIEEITKEESLKVLDMSKQEFDALELDLQKAAKLNLFTAQLFIGSRDTLMITKDKRLLSLSEDVLYENKSVDEKEFYELLGRLNSITNIDKAAAEYLELFGVDFRNKIKVIKEVN